MKWQLKFLKNSIIGILPKPIQYRTRKIKRTLFPLNLDLDLNTLNQGLRQIQMLKSSNVDPYNKDYLELGTGWCPVIPLLFYLAGCKSLILIDDQRLMDENTFRKTCEQLITHSRNVSKKLEIDECHIKTRLTEIANLPLKPALSKMNCNYLAPYSFAPVEVLGNYIPSHSVDIITSRAVLEYIPPPKLNIIFKEFHRILRNDGAMCHIIDNSDHWEHEDKTISQLNFLKYNQLFFSFISSMNPLDYLNRLRHSEYIKIAQSTGFKVIKNESQPDPRALYDLNSLKIHPDFASFSKEDLAILTSYIVLGKESR